MRRYSIGFRRFSVIVLSVLMIATMMPLIGEHAYAAKLEEPEEAKAAAVENGTVDVELPEDEVKAAEEKAKKEAGVEEEGVSVEEAGEEAPEEEDEGPGMLTVDGKEVDPEDIGLEDAASKNIAADLDMKDKKLGLSSLELNVQPALGVSLDAATGVATVAGMVSGDTFYSLMVDGETVYYFNDGVNSFSNLQIDMKEYSVGLHQISVMLTDSYETWYYSSPVPTYIYGTPSNGKSYYETSVKSFSVYYPGSSYYYDYDCDVYLGYKVGKKKWKEGYGPVSTSSYSKSKRSGFKANSKIQIHLYFGKQFDYNGQTVAITGRTKGAPRRVSKAVTIKTAFKKPKVKSIKINHAKVKTYKWRVHYANRYYYRNGILYRIRPLYHTYKTYQTKFRVNVSFKKKQGIAGVYIRCKDLYARRGGNKKKYRVTFTLNGRKKGKSVIIRVQSYRSSIYGGYSKEYKKRVGVH